MLKKNDFHRFDLENDAICCECCSQNREVIKKPSSTYVAGFGLLMGFIDNKIIKMECRHYPLKCD